MSPFHYAGDENLFVPIDLAFDLEHGRPRACVCGLGGVEWGGGGVGYILWTQDNNSVAWNNALCAQRYMT